MVREIVSVLYGLARVASTRASTIAVQSYKASGSITALIAGKAETLHPDAHLLAGARGLLELEAGHGPKLLSQRPERFRALVGLRLGHPVERALEGPRARGHGRPVLVVKRTA